MNDALLRVRITGFGPLRNVTLEPGRLTVLVGASGAGKTSVLRAIRMVTLMRNGALQRFIKESGGASALLHHGAKRTSEIGIELDFRQGDKSNRYTSRLGFAEDDKLKYLDETIGFQRMRFSKMQVVSLGSGHWESLLRDSGKAGNVTARVLNFRLSRVAAFQFRDASNSSTLSIHARADDDQYLRSNASNLAAFLGRLARSESDADKKAWNRITECVSAALPSVKRLSPTSATGGEPSVRLDWGDLQNQGSESSPLSAGELRTIALITALAQPAERLPSFICIDEPELGLSPVAVEVLAELARSVSGQTQVLFATRSTAFLEYFKPEEVVVVQQKDGESTLVRLDATDLKSWVEARDC